MSTLAVNVGEHREHPNRSVGIGPGVDQLRLTPIDMETMVDSGGWVKINHWLCDEL